MQVSRPRRGERESPEQGFNPQPQPLRGGWPQAALHQQVHAAVPGCAGSLALLQQKD